MCIKKRTGAWLLQRRNAVDIYQFLNFKYKIIYNCIILQQDCNIKTVILICTFYFCVLFIDKFRCRVVRWSESWRSAQTSVLVLQRGLHQCLSLSRSLPSGTSNLSPSCYCMYSIVFVMFSDSYPLDLSILCTLDK